MNRRLLILVACAGLAPIAHAADEADGAWRASASVSLWRPALQDDLRLPGGAGILVEDANLDEAELVPLLEARFTNGDWAIDLGGFVFEADSSSESPAGFQLGSVVVAPGGAYSAEADYGSFWILATKRLAEKPLRGEGDSRALLWLNVGAGARVSDLRAEVASGGSRDVEDALWVEGLAVARVGAELPGGVDFEVHGEVGGGPDSAMWSVGTRLTWSPEPWWGAHIGYRFIRTDLDDDGFEFDGALGGLYAGATIEF